MINKTKLALLVKQSKFNKDQNRIIDIIAPIICNKKITKREIDKANQALVDAFGVFSAYKDHSGKEIKIALYTVSKYVDYGTKINIYASDRSVKDGDYGCSYMPENVRTIYLTHNQDSLTVDELNAYKFKSDYMPTEKQIIRAYDEYEAINEKISKLEDKKRALPPFHYYFNR